MKHLFIPLGFGLLLFAGCSKDAPETPQVVLDGEYQAAATITTAPISMYTKDGLVNNPALVDRYLSRRSWSASYFPRADVAIPGNSALTLTFGNANQAKLISTGSGRADTTKAEVTSQLADYFVLAMRDSVQGFSTPVSNRCTLLAGQMDAINPVKRCAPVSQATGFSQFCKFRPILVVKINAGRLFIPQYSWLIESSQRGSTCSWSVARAWNLFNASVLNQLTAGDTLVVQERTIALSKK